MIINVTNIFYSTFFRSALFSESVDIDGDISDFPAPKPVILQHRNTSINQSRSRFIEDAPSSTRASLGGKVNVLVSSLMIFYIASWFESLR